MCTLCVSTWYVNESSKSAQRRWERPNTGEESAWRSSMELFSLFPFSNLNNDPTRRLLYFQLSYYDVFLPRCYKEVIVWGFLEDGVWVIGTSSSASCPPLVLRANFLQEKPKPQRRLKFTPCARFRVFLPAFASEPAGVPTYEPPNTGGWEARRDVAHEAPAGGRSTRVCLATQSWPAVSWRRGRTAPPLANGSAGFFTEHIYEGLKPKRYFQGEEWRESF